MADIISNITNDNYACSE